MNWDAIGAAGELIGAIVVVASVLYLGRQISQTNRIARTSVSREHQVRYGEIYQWICTDQEITNLVAKLRDPEYRAQSAEEEEKIENYHKMLDDEARRRGGVVLDVHTSH